MTAEFDPQYGKAIELEEGVRRLVAPNPSPMTFCGTNTYLVGTDDVAVIDPGPSSDEHLNAILNALSSRQKVTKIIVTHSHLDHSPLARPLAEKTGAPVLAYGGPIEGRSTVMVSLAENGLSSGGEGIDTTFSPDEQVKNGDVISGSNWSLEVLHTPGHLGNHICLAWKDTCFTADHVMGWASSLVSPPDGDLTDFMASCARLQHRPWRRFFPGHGQVIEDPAARLEWLVDHRREREASILFELEKKPADVATLTARIYAETPQKLQNAAQRNVLAHLIDLHQKSQISFEGKLSTQTVFSLLPDHRHKIK